MSPLACAAKLGNTQLCRFFLDSGAPINALNTERELTALVLAARYGRVDACHYLIARGCSLSLGDRYRDTALHWCSYKGHLKVVRLLLQHNVDPALKDDDNRTALDLAKAKGFTEIVALLEKVMQPKPAPVIDLVADSNKRKREDDSGDSVEMQGLVERAALAEAKLESETRGREREMRGREQAENELSIALVRCAKADRDAVTLSAMRQEENRRSMQAIELEKQATRQAISMAVSAEAKAVAAENLVGELQERLSKLQGKVSQIVMNQIVVKQECQI